MIFELFCNRSGKVPFDNVIVVKWRCFTNNSGTRDAPRRSWEVVPWDQSWLSAGSFDRLHIENDAVFLLTIAAHISATGVGVYVRRNKEPSGRRSSPSLECSLLLRLRGGKMFWPMPTNAAKPTAEPREWTARHSRTSKRTA